LKNEQDHLTNQQLTNPIPRRCWLPVPSLIALKTSRPHDTPHKSEQQSQSA
jgi:hypothetical protein